MSQQIISAKHMTAMMRVHPSGQTIIGWFMEHDVTYRVRHIDGRPHFVVTFPDKPTHMLFRLTWHAPNPK